MHSFQIYNTNALVSALSTSLSVLSLLFLKEETVLSQLFMTGRSHYSLYEKESLLHNLQNPWELL